MSQLISQSRLFTPVDRTLPRHAMFLQTDDDKWHIVVVNKNWPRL